MLLKLLLPGVLLGAVMLPLNAQELPGMPTSAPESVAEDATTPEQIASRASAVDADINALQNRLAKADTDEAKLLQTQLGRLQDIDRLLKQQQLLAVRVVPVPAKAETDKEDKASVFALNNLYEEKHLLEKTIEQHKDEQLSRRDALVGAKKDLDNAERNRREVRQKYDQASAANKAGLKHALTMAQLGSRFKAEQVNLKNLELDLAQQQPVPSFEAQIENIDQRISQLRLRLANGENDSAAGFAALLERDTKLRRLREGVARRMATTQLRQEAAQSRFSRQSNPEAELLEVIESLTTQIDVLQQQNKLIDVQAERLADQRVSWQRWQSLLAESAPREELPSWEKETEQRVSALQQREQLLKARSADLQQRLELFDVKLESIAEQSVLRQPMLAEQQELRSLLAAQRDETGLVAAERRVNDRLLTDLQAGSSQLNLIEYVVGVVKATADLWRYEITAIDDAPVTVGSLIIGLVLFGIGLWASRLGSRLVGRMADQRLKLDAGASQALQSLSFYILLVAFTLMALRVVHFPLTAFTVLGGALAIGIGFGSQNVMNNFISGLILMLERPVRARDVVVIDDNTGTIEKIGARSTQIRSTDGRHIIVPNSFFLESNVVNWTLSDDLIRATVMVGVAYGSPTRLVEQLIARVVKEEELILKTPEPIIIFDEFGDNSLNFNVYFWVHARSPMGVRQVQSRVRFAIDDLFREHELVIAYPQRDVHLDSLTPIEIRMVDSKKAAEQSSGSESTGSAA
jgi:small-conductance mechanosensitive channel